MRNSKDFKNSPDAKFRPPAVPTREFNQVADKVVFNEKGKVTNTKGSDYHDLSRKDSGLYGNFSEKDASLDYLRGRNKDGQRIRNYSGNSLNSELRTGAGSTAYDGRPIPEVYKPATSQGSVPPNAVVYTSIEKTRNDSLPKQQNTSAESDSLTEDQTKHLKAKE